jgi:hypothetical protein
VGLHKSDDELIAQADQRGFWVCKNRYSMTLRGALGLPGPHPLDGPEGTRVEVDQIARLRTRITGV